MAKSKVPTAPKNAKEGIAQSKALINKYAVPSKAKTVKTSTKPKTDSKKAIPASDPRYKNMSPAERNANTLKNIKESLAGPKKETTIKNNFKKSISTVKKAEVKKPDTKKSKVDNTSIEQKAKDVIRGKYGSGADRKKALGADYDKVQAIVNKQMASSKPKTALTKEATKTIEAPSAPEKMEIKKAGPIPYTGPKELAMTAEQKMNANIDKLNKEKKKYGGSIKTKMKKYQDGGLTGAELKRRGEAKKRMGNEMKANGESSKRIGEAQKAAYMRKKSEVTYKKKNV